jgi:hypothetical protein
MGKRKVPSFTLALAVGLSASTSVSAAPPAKYLVVVRGIEELEGVRSEAVKEVKELFVAALRSHPEFTLDWPSDLPTEPEALKQALRTRKLRAFEVTLRIKDVSRALQPPPPGKQYRVLERGIRLSVFGDTLPDKIMAIGGDGESRIATEIGRQSDETKEGKSLLLEAAKIAVTQAVDMTVTKLALAAKPERARKIH